MGVTVYTETDKIHFDLDGEHKHSIRIYDFQSGKFDKKTVDDIRREYEKNMQKEFFAELLRYTQGEFSKSDDEIIYQCKKTPLGAVFKISNREENSDGELVNVSLNTVGNITYRGSNILSIANDRNEQLYRHFVDAMNNRIETADLF